MTSTRRPPEVYTTRFALGIPNEERVAAAVRACGWHVGPFAHALLTEEMFGDVKTTDSLMRYLPDLIATRRHPDPYVDCIRLIDAKAGRTDTPNYDFDNAAVLAYQRWALFDVDVWVVFPDLRCARAADVWTSPDRHQGTYRGNGSGVSFSLLPKHDPCVMSLREGFGS
jgi:hypothetical protein